MTRKTITESEYEVMKVLWSSGVPLTVGEIYNKLPETESKWSKNTVATLLTRLCEKGVAAYKKSGSFHHYYAVLEKNDYNVSEAKSFVSRIFGGSVKNMVASLYESKELSQDEIEELRELFKVD